MMATVVGANARGVRVTATVQLGLAAALAGLLLVAVITALPSAHAGNWTPFAPHGWLAIGSAANLLMLSLVGWEAVSHLAGDLADPGRDLPRAMLAAFAVVVVLYLGLAVTTVAVLGATGSNVPLADLMQRGLGEPGRVATAAVAVLLTTGAMNAYVAGAGRLAGALADDGAMPRWMARPSARLAVFAMTGTLILTLLATAAVSLFLVTVVLAFSGPYLAAPVAAALLGAWAGLRRGARQGVVRAALTSGGATSPGSPAGPGCRTAS
jgi:amino acid efflux transporter